MTREEAIKRLSDIRADYSCFDDDERPKYHALSMAIEALQDDWILVSETSFLQAGEYLATAEDGNGFRFTDKFGYTPTTDGGWYDPEEPNQTDIDWNKWIIAWKPLPAPYKESEE